MVVSEEQNYGMLSFICCVSVFEFFHSERVLHILLKESVFSFEKDAVL